MNIYYNMIINYVYILILTILKDPALAQNFEWLLDTALRMLSLVQKASIYQS